VGEAEVESPRNVVHEALKRLGSVAHDGRYEAKLEESKSSGDGGSLYVAGMDGNLVEFPHQIDVGEEAATTELVRVIMYVTDGIAVGNGSGV
jgi:hypothetical protein